MSADMMSRFHGVQGMIADALEIVRAWPHRGHLPHDVELIEDGLAIAAFELQTIARDLRSEVARIDASTSEALRLVDQARSELDRSAQRPSPPADMLPPDHPAAGFQAGPYQVSIDAAAQTVVVRALDSNVLHFPDALTRAIYRLGRDGGAA